MAPTLTNIHKINMKGALLKENNQRIVEHWEGLKVKEYPLLPKDATSCLDGDKGKEIEFEIVDYSQRCRECGETVERGRNCIKGCFMKSGNFIPTDKLEYAKLTPLKEVTHLDTWNEIFAEIEGSLHASLPLRVKNWLRNKFNPPTQKSS